MTVIRGSFATLIAAMIGSLGYSVVAVETGSNALQAMEQKRIDLVVTDVVLPGGVSGPEFADRARRLYPGLKVVFMSGYPAGMGGHSTTLRSDDVLISKPFRKAELSKVIKDVFK
jgi:CheY-like chemotaxis protein